MRKLVSSFFDPLANAGGRLDRFLFELDGHFALAISNASLRETSRMRKEDWWGRNSSETAQLRRTIGTLNTETVEMGAVD